MGDLLSFEKCIELTRGFEKRNILLGSGFSAGINKGLMYSFIQHEVSYPYRQYINKKAPNLEKTMHYLHENNIYIYGSPLTKDKLRHEVLVILLEHHFKRFSEISDSRILLCHNFLRHFNLIFSTNFDLYLYAVQIHPKLKRIYSDGFYTKRDKSGKRIWNNIRKTSKQTSVYYIHGVFYLCYDEDTKKTKWIETELFQIPLPIDTYDTTYCIKKTAHLNKPLVNIIKQDIEKSIVIFDSTYSDKCRQIITAPYLSAAFSRLGGQYKNDKLDTVLFIFGHSLDKDVDGHIIHQINTNLNIKEIYYGIYDDSLEERQRIVDLFSWKGLPKNIHFFNTREMDIWGSKALDDSFLKLPFKI